MCSGCAGRCERANSGVGTDAGVAGAGGGAGPPALAAEQRTLTRDVLAEHTQLILTDPLHRPLGEAGRSVAAPAVPTGPASRAAAHPRSLNPCPPQGRRRPRSRTVRPCRCAPPERAATGSHRIPVATVRQRLPDTLHTTGVSLTRRGDGSYTLAISGHGRVNLTPQLPRVAPQFLPMFAKRWRDGGWARPRPWSACTCSTHGPPPAR